MLQDNNRSRIRKILIFTNFGSGPARIFFFSFISGPAKHYTKLSLVGARNKTISKMLQDNNRSRIRKMSSEGHNGDCCSATVSRRAQLHVLLRNCALRNRAELLQHFPLHRQRRSSFYLFSTCIFNTCTCVSIFTRSGYRYFPPFYIS